MDFNSENIKLTEGGVTAPLGFKASGMHCGLRKNKSKKDLAMIFAECDCAAAGVFTQNKVFAAPVGVTRENLKNGHARAVICNSGNANTCNSDGYDKAYATCKAVAETLGIDESDVIVASTGVIGVPLPIEPIINCIPVLAEQLERSFAAAEDAATAIMTTDTKKKEFAVTYNCDGNIIKIGGMCKGSGMIHPNMATMLVFITTDASISPAMLQKALSEDIKTTFNMVSVDGDTSTNDMVMVLANGMAENPEIVTENQDYKTFCEALNTVNVYLCRMIAGDGEGATKLLECKVTGAKTDSIAKTVAKSVICSSLTKAAMFGADANWGRVLCAIGYSGANVDVEKIDVSFKSAAGEIEVCKNGAGVDFSEEKAKEILLKNEIEILVSLNDGEYDATAWGCDLTYDYVKINGDYRT